MIRIRESVFKTRYKTCLVYVDVYVTVITIINEDIRMGEIIVLLRNWLKKFYAWRIYTFSNFIIS